MARQFTSDLAAEYPEYSQLKRLLNLAAYTWPKYGISADNLSAASDWDLEILQAAINA